MPTDAEVRGSAFAAIKRLTAASGGIISRELMQRGFEFAGNKVPFANKPRGIWKPGILGPDGAALSITTATIPRNGTPRYDDQIASTDGAFRYKYQDRGPEVSDNRALRRAMVERLPLIYFYGVGPGLYHAITPVLVVGDDREKGEFEVAADGAAIGLESEAAADGFGIIKRYATTVVKRRLHQDRFRTAVVHAYRGRCTVCRLGHEELIDAAHILEDKDQLGLPEITNGLALCKIHHAAYDSNILGISPDRVVRIREDVLAEVDGPMLRHGLQEADGKRIIDPVKTEWRPNPDYLGARYDRFLAA